MTSWCAQRNCETENWLRIANETGRVPCAGADVGTLSHHQTFSYDQQVMLERASSHLVHNGSSSKEHVKPKYFLLSVRLYLGYQYRFWYLAHGQENSKLILIISAWKLSNTFAAATPKSRRKVVKLLCIKEGSLGEISWNHSLHQQRGWHRCSFIWM